MRCLKTSGVVAGSEGGSETGLEKSGCHGGEWTRAWPWRREPDLIGTHLNGAAAGSFQEERFEKTAAVTLKRAELSR